MVKIAEVSKNEQINNLKLDTWAKAGKWMIETFKPTPSKDAWYVTAGKIGAIVVLGLLSAVLALPTFSLSVAVPLYALFKGSRVTVQASRQEQLPPNPSIPALPNSLLVKDSQKFQQPDLVRSEQPKTSGAEESEKEKDQVLATTRDTENPDSVRSSEQFEVSGAEKSEKKNVRVLPTPVGIENPDTACAFIDGVLVMLNAPAFRDIAKQIGDQGIAVYANLYKEYATCQEQQNAKTLKTSGENSAFKAFRAYMADKYPEKGFGPGELTCVDKVLTCLLQDWKSYGFTPCAYALQYTDACLKNNKDYQPEQGKTLNGFGLYHVSLFNDSRFKQLGTMLKFQTFSVGDEPFDDYRALSSDTILMQYCTPPDHIILLTENDNLASIENPLELILESEIVVSGESAKYECCFFNYFAKGNPNLKVIDFDGNEQTVSVFGHCYGYLKVNEQWYQIEDSYADPISEEKAIELARDVNSVRVFTRTA